MTIPRIDMNKIDRILASEEELVPSSGFLAAVMERVREEAAAPPPIPFPWRRALPGILLAAGGLGWGGFELVRHGLPLAELSLALPRVSFVGPLHLSLTTDSPLQSAGWVALALIVSLLSWLLSRRIAGRSGLL